MSLNRTVHMVTAVVCLLGERCWQRAQAMFLNNILFI